MVPYCNQCGRYWFDFFDSCVIILVANEDNEIAMLKQHYLSDIYWTYVAGYMKPGETAEEAARREVQEELGLKIERLEYGGTYWFAQKEQLMHGFIGFVKKSDMTLSQEVDKAVWVPAEEAPKMMFPERKGNSQQPLFRIFKSLLKDNI